MGYVEELRSLVGSRPLILFGAVVLILNENGQVLLQKRTEPKGRWGLPGGLMELGESPEETATREVLEETGLHVQNLQLLNVYSGASYFVKLQNGDEFQTVTATYYTRQYSGAMITNTSETMELQFFSLVELPAEMVGSHRRMIEAYHATARA